MRRGGFSHPNWGPVRRAPGPHIWKDQRRAPAVVELRRPFASRKDPTLSDSKLDGLIAALPVPPHNFFVYHSGPVAGKLLFWQWRDALEAVIFFWKRLLEGAHLLTPRAVSGIPFSIYKVEEESRLKSLFVDHARGLLSCEQVVSCKRMIELVTRDIASASKLLQRPSAVVAFYERRAKKKRLEEEREQLEGRFKEFRTAIWCILAHLGEWCGLYEGMEESEEWLKEVFALGEKPDWSRLHFLMVRECQRFDEGLPIYACRRKILQSTVSNQVMVLIGETGSGKSTQLVQFLADSGLASGSIVCTQPRKIAATSLAQRVHVESNGCYGNNFVNSYPTYLSTKEISSGIIFMTDHCLLQYCMNDMSLTGVSYVVVDEAHERSLNTDLVLAIVKKSLIKRSDLRLIIMSATADASKLADYFCGCCTFYVMGRTFPVEIKYVPDVSTEASWTSSKNISPRNCDSYVSDVIKMVSMIHKKDENGAILAFLTSQVEVELACRSFSDPSAVVLPMHGKLSGEEQSRIFQDFQGKRKIIFSTNIAETSLTIQGVKYVVDSGMAKDCRFEPSTGMSVLKVGRISQSSANQRAGRAGRTEPGKCYRLYSEFEFQSMKLHQEPEIRKVHLGIAALRILALGIQNIQDFEFVDAPSPEAVIKAMQNLVQLGAITYKNDVFELTDTGQSMVKLAIEPRLGKIILDCFSFGLRKEGLVLAAVMANSSSIFCRMGSDDEKYKADCLKVPFCHKEGDLFTLLSVYKEWENEHASKNTWCWQNSINAKSMRRCQETILEFESTLKNELNVVIPSYWLWNPHEPSLHDKCLKKVILSSFTENIAMHCGHDRLGYEVAATGQTLQLHPSCSLLAYGTKPSWVVFGEILSTSNRYLVCVTAVDCECLYMFQPPLFDISQLESRKMEMNMITGVGNNLLRRFCGKSNNNLCNTISRIQNVCMDDRISVDIDFENGAIQVYAQAKDMEKVSCIVNDALDLERKLLRDECVEKYLFRGGPELSPFALFGSGAEIKHLEVDKRYLTLELSHINARSLNDKELIRTVHHHVPSIANFCKFQGSGHDLAELDKWGKITFLNAEAAEEAALLMNNLEFEGYPLKVAPVSAGDHKTLPFPSVRAKVCWPRRPTNGVALITCAEEDAKYIVQDCFTLGIGEKYVKCEVSTKYRNCIFVTGLPIDISEPELYDIFHNATTRRILDIHLLRGAAISGPPSNTCEEALVRLIAPFMTNKQFPGHYFRVEVFVPEPKDYMMNAAITFDGRLHLEAAKALEHIQGTVLPGCLRWQKIQSKHVFQSSVFCPARVFGVIHKQLDSLLESFKNQKGVSYNLEKNANGSYRIKITANATKTIADLRKPLEQLTKGKVVSDPSITPLILRLLFSRDGIILLKTVERETGTYILYDRQHLNVHVFGPSGEVNVAVEKLVQELISLHDNKPLEIRLRGQGLPPDLLKDVVRRFGPDLQGLKEQVPGIQVTLNTRGHILFVRGNKEQKGKVEKVIFDVVHSLDSEGAVLHSSEGATCPICLCELDEPYKLEACGHDFCRNCLTEQCESAIRSREGFPLCCSKEGCKNLIWYVDLKFLLSTDKLEELFRASLGAFVACSGSAYRFCPSPDCPSVYRVATAEENARPFICGACLVETCTKCHLENHPFISCERYREYKEDPDLSLVEWRKGKAQVKDCPACSHTIEKIDGCNHIECKCGRHICWSCLEHFDSSDGCYDHLRSLQHAIE